MRATNSSNQKKLKQTLKLVLAPTNSTNPLNDHRKSYPRPRLKAEGFPLERLRRPGSSHVFGRTKKGPWGLSRGVESFWGTMIQYYIIL